MSKTIILICTISLLLAGCFEKESRSQNSLKQISRSELTYRGPVDRSIQLQFSYDKSSISEITALVRLPQNFQGDVNYKWTPGSGLKIQDGITEGTLNSVKTSRLILKIKVLGFDHEDLRHLRFEISGSNSPRRIYADGIISNQQKKSFESIVTEIENYKKETLHEK